MEEEKWRVQMRYMPLDGRGDARHYDVVGFVPKSEVGRRGHVDANDEWVDIGSPGIVAFKAVRHYPLPPPMDISDCDWIQRSCHTAFRM